MDRKGRMGLDPPNRERIEPNERTHPRDRTDEKRGVRFPFRFPAQTDGRWVDLPRVAWGLRDRRFEDLLVPQRMEKVKGEEREGVILCEGCKMT